MKDLTPKDHAEAVATFRHAVIGSVCARELSRGELAEALRQLALVRVRPPGSPRTKTYSVPTLERWLYAYRRGGLPALRPRTRSDRGRGRDLSDALRQLVCDIRREHPSASARLIIRTLEAERYGREVIRELWSAQRDSAANTAWVQVLDEVLRAAHESTLADAFADFTRWNLYTDTRADPGLAYAKGEGYPAVKAKSGTLPLEDNPRIFPLAAKVYSARVAKSGALRLALRADGPLSGVRLLLAHEAGGRIREVKEARAADDASVQLEQVAAGDAIIAAVINTRLAGESARPDVCLGSISDTQNCVKGAGTATADAGEPDADDASHDTSSGCTVIAMAGRGHGVWCLLVFGAALGIGRRRAKRAQLLRGV